MKIAKQETLLNTMKTGQVDRRSALLMKSAAADRYLDRLVKENKLLKVSGGLYVRPEQSAFGFVPPDDNSLVKTFLKDNRFLITSFNNYNQLGLGLTQLYNNQMVYNYKRHGEFELGGKKFFFKRMPKFPRQLSKEYLLVDMFNNLKNLAEDEKKVVQNFFSKKEDFDSKKVLSVAKEYGRPSTRKLLEKAYGSK